MDSIWRITLLTLGMALTATVVMLPAGLLLAWALARGRFPGRVLLETLVSLPLVMPPVATGLVLLTLLAPRGPVGGFLGGLGIEIVFTWKAVVIAMAVMGLPLLVRTARAGFEQVNVRYERVAATLGASPARVFLTISLPLAWPSVLAGAVLAFARALGEFGATILFAGNLEGVTQTMPMAIYLGFERNLGIALALSVVLVIVSVFLLMFTKRLEKHEAD